MMKGLYGGSRQGSAEKREESHMATYKAFARSIRLIQDIGR